MSAVGKTAPYTDSISSDHYTGMADQKLAAEIAAHELREPSQAILSFLCVLLEERAGPLTSIQRDFLATAEQAARRLRRRIEDLQLVMAGCATLSINARETDLRTRVEECCHELELIASSYNVQLRIEDRHTGPQPLTWADPDRVDQILLNLIENAIQYSACGSEVIVTIDNCGPDAWCIRVENTVSQPLREDPCRWFMPHIRGSNGHELRPEGQGLGLVAAGMLVRAHNGSIVARAEGNTVTIDVVLPRNDPGIVDNISSLTWADAWQAP